MCETWLSSADEYRGINQRIRAPITTPQYINTYVV